MRRAAAFCTRCNVLVDSGRPASTALQQSSRLSTSAVTWPDQTLGDFLTSRATVLTQSPQPKEATADNTTDVMLHRQRIVELDAKILYDFDRLDDIIADWKRRVSRRQLAQVSTTAEPLPLRFKSAFNWSRRDEHQSRLSVTQQRNWWRCHFRDLTRSRSVELFVVSEQVTRLRVKTSTTSSV